MCFVCICMLLLHPVVTCPRGLLPRQLCCWWWPASWWCPGFARSSGGTTGAPSTRQARLGSWCRPSTAGAPGCWSEGRPIPLLPPVPMNAARVSLVSCRHYKTTKNKLQLKKWHNDWDVTQVVFLGGGVLGFFAFSACTKYKRKEVAVHVMGHWGNVATLIFYIWELSLQHWTNCRH